MVSVRSRSLLGIGLFVLVAVPFVHACSEDSTSGEKGGQEAGAGTGGRSGSGGASTAAGAPGAGGFDPALALECGRDAGSDECRLCLAAMCCDAYEGCMGDAACAAAFEVYRTCVDGSEKADADCYSDFTLAVSEGGSLAAVPACIVTSCMGCGGPPVF